MNPLAFRLVIGVAVLIALLAGAWYVKTVIAENAELKIEAAEKDKQISVYQAEAKAEQQTASILADIRDTIDTQKQSLLDAILAKPLTRTITREVQVNGETQSVACVERDAGRYFSLFNAAINGDTAPADGVPEPVPDQ